MPSMLAASRPDHLPLALLVDRDQDTRRMYAVYLQSTCDVEEAEDGREALAKALARQPNVIVTETRLPGMDGVELCRILRADEQTCGIPIVFVTGDASAENTTCADVCADAILVKPCLPERLAAEIHRLLLASRSTLMQSRDARVRSAEQVRRADAALGRPAVTVRRTIASRAFQRQSTTEPPSRPLSLVCPSCDHPLRYMRSHVGGVSERHAEQWDYFECPTGCGTFQYRHRTRKLRRVT